MSAAPNLARELAQVLVPVLRGKNGKGWPEHEQGMRASYTVLGPALAKAHAHDAHFACYSVPDVQRRLASPRVFDMLAAGVPMVLFVVDVDDPETDIARESWMRGEWNKIERLLGEHPGGYVYRTRGGYRIVYMLAEAFVLKSSDDADRWKRTYLAWLEYIRERYQIDGDNSCQDWTRLYRLPNVVRDGARLSFSTVGDVDAIGTWDVEVTLPEPEQRTSERRESTYTAKPGAFDIRAALAQACPGVDSKKTKIADSYFVECPWKSEHSSDSGPTQTTVFVYPDGAWEFKCLHNHCADRDHNDFRQWLDPTWKPYDPNAPRQSLREVDPEHEPEHIDEAYAPTVEPGEQDEFARDEDGRIYVTQRNVMLALRKLGVSVSADEFARHELIHGLKGFGPRLDDAGLRELRLLIDDRFTFRLGKEFFVDVVTRHAWLNRFHPVRDYLASLKWDGKPRIDRWLVNAGAPDTSYVLAVSRLVLIAAVRRIRRPGVKFDEMPILESKQGTNKSSALRLLSVRDDWFIDDLPLDGDTKQLIEQTSGKWLVEAGELKGMSKGDVAKLKACLSRQVDEARLAYGHKNTIAPRQFVIIGTTNESDGYLKDTTGNRRFWPVSIEQFNLEQLARDRDQLWAEAAHAEAAGESIRLDPVLWGAAANEQTEREAEDPMIALLHHELGARCGKLRTLDALALLNIEPGKVTQDQNARIGAAMRKLGWDRKRRRIGGDLAYAYVKGTDDEREIEIVVDVTEYGGRRQVNVSGGVL